MKKFFFILFSLIMMCSVSFGLDMGQYYTRIDKIKDSNSIPDVDILDYTQLEIRTILLNMTNDSTNESYKTMYDTLLSDLDKAGVKYVAYKYNSEYWLLISNPENDYDVAIGYDEQYADGYSKYKLLAPMNETLSDTAYIGFYIFAGKSSLTKMHSYCSFSSSYNYIDLMMSDFLSSNTNIYNLTQEKQSGQSNLKPYDVYWDGTEYFYQHTSSGGSEEPSIPGIVPGEVPELTDEELAELVTRFVNSDAFVSNVTNLDDDYFITYDRLMECYHAYTYSFLADLCIEYGNYDEEGNFVTSGTTEGEAWQIRPYVFNGSIFERFRDWLNSKFNVNYFGYYTISADSSIEPRYISKLEYLYCSNYVDYEVVVYSTEQISLLSEYTDEEGNTDVVVTENFIPKTTLTNSETGEEIIIEISDEITSNTPFSKFASLIKGGFEGLLTGIKAIFVPSEDFLSDKANQILYKINFYTSLQTTFDDLIASMTKDSEGAPQITVDFDLSEDSIFYGVGSANVLDFSWYEPFKPVVDLFIIAFVYGVFIYTFIKELPNTIAGITEAFDYMPLKDSQYSGSGKVGFKPGGGKK